MQNQLLKLSSWWSYSAKSGKKEMVINEDGSFTGKLEYALEKDKDDNTETKGNIDENRMHQLKEFLDKNVTNNSKSEIFDAGYKIEYTKNSGVITVENDTKLWDHIINLLPEYNESLN